MRFNETLLHSMVVYASIHPNRVSVLDHLFGGLGGGYEWYRGELRDGYPGERSHRRELKNIRKFFREDFNSEKTIKLFVLKSKPWVILDNTMISTDKDEKFRELTLSIAEYREMKNIYTIKEEMRGKEYVLIPDNIQERMEDRNYSDWHEIHNKYSSIMIIPDDIKPDWLNAAFEYLTLLLESKLSVDSLTLWHIKCKSPEKAQIEADRLNTHNYKVAKKILKSLKKKFPNHIFKFNKTLRVVQKKN